MATQYQLRGGTTAENLLFTGAQREVTVDTDLHTLVVQDGITAGGYPLATGAQVKNGTFYFNEDAGSAANAYILVPKTNTNTPTAYLGGVQFGFVTTHPNTGPSTANFTGLGVKNLKFAGGVDPVAGELSGRVYLIYDEVNDWLEIQRKATGAPPQIQTVGASVGGSALTASLDPCTIDFRSSTLSSGVILRRAVAATISVVVPSGATLGTVSAAASRLVLLAIYGPSAVELAIINLAGGLNLDETTLISTTAISAAATAANVAYSTTARASVPFRVVGFIDSTQASAGTWASAPSTIQGAGGQALAAMSSIGYGQTWQNLTGSRAVATTYTNSTGKPIQVHASFQGNTASGVRLDVLINGAVMLAGSVSGTGYGPNMEFIVPPGGTYRINITLGTQTLVAWSELR